MSQNNTPKNWAELAHFLAGSVYRWRHERLRNLCDYLSRTEIRVSRGDVSSVVGNLSSSTPTPPRRLRLKENEMYG